MKLVVNKGVRDCVAELDQLLLEHAEVCRILANPGGMPPTALSGLGLQRARTEKCIVGCAARIISHATRGKRYPHMTDYIETQW